MVKRLAVVAATLALVAGCGAVAEEPSQAPKGTSDAFPVTITHALGESTIDSPPSRVVVVGTSTDDLDAALALGVAPVAFVSKSYAEPDGIPPWLEGRLDPAKTEVVNANSGVDPEAVGQFAPDLILASADFGLEDEYDGLAAIAPTIGFEKSWGEQTWQEHVRVVGKALGLTDKADEVVATTEKAIADVKAAHPGAAGKTFTASVGNTPGKIFTLISKDDAAVRLIEDLGPQLAPEIQDAEKWSEGTPTGELAPEQYDKLAADLVLIAFTGDDLKQAFESNQLVRDIIGGNYLVVDMDTITAVRMPSVYGIPWALERIEPGLAKLG